MNKFVFSSLFSILNAFSSSAVALTERDCRERVNNAMYNSDKLGGNDADAYRWAQNAANECFKEMARSGSSLTENSRSSGGMDWSFIGIWILLLIIYGAPAFVFQNSPNIAKIIFYILAAICTVGLFSFSMAEYKKGADIVYLFIFGGVLVIDYAGYRFYRWATQDS